MPLRLLMERSRPRGKAIRRAAASRTHALSLYGDCGDMSMPSPSNTHPPPLTQSSPKNCATMGGAKSPMMTKNAIQVPRLRPIILQKIYSHRTVFTKLMTLYQSPDSSDVLSQAAINTKSWGKKQIYFMLPNIYAMHTHPSSRRCCYGS